MPGSSSSTNTSQNQNGATSLTSNQDQSQSGTQSSSTNPWATAMPTVNGILGQLNPLIASSGINPTQASAIGQLTSNAADAGQYAPAIGSYATSLLNGGGATAQAPALQSNLSTLQSQLSPYATGSMVGNNTALQSQLNQIGTDVSDQVNSEFAAAGRDGSGMNQQTLARGIAAGEAPVIADQYNQEVANQLNAANSLYGAGNTTSSALSGLQQQQLANQGQGIDAATAATTAQNAAPTAALTAQQYLQSIPTQNLGLLAQIGLPIAGLGGTSSGTTNGNTTGNNTANGTSNMSGTGTSTTQNNPSLLSSLTSLGGLFSAPAGGTSAVGGLLSFLSDRRAKEDVTQVGKLFDGTPVYRFRYIGQPGFQIGLMAQDVEKETPEAVSEINGLKLVDYKIATDKAVEAGSR